MPTSKGPRVPWAQTGRWGGQLTPILCVSSPHLSGHSGLRGPQTPADMQGTPDPMLAVRSDQLLLGGQALAGSHLQDPLGAPKQASRMWWGMDPTGPSLSEWWDHTPECGMHRGPVETTSSVTVTVALLVLPHVTLPHILPPLFETEKKSHLHPSLAHTYPKTRPDRYHKGGILPSRHTHSLAPKRQ
ncbi:unnamed protein product [Rangifer tarandus platyrhynchus]|uniref:Uncharacterized protein n=1 Tax=Rangifer tarandus platyrhynchus TaxID=3082113 RepID=A0AC59ZYH8_RANTA